MATSLAEAPLESTVSNLDLTSCEHFFSPFDGSHARPFEFFAIAIDK